MVASQEDLKAVFERGAEEHLAGGEVGFEIGVGFDLHGAEEKEVVLDYFDKPGENGIPFGIFGVFFEVGEGEGVWVEEPLLLNHSAPIAEIPLDYLIRVGLELKDLSQFCLTPRILKQIIQRNGISPLHKHVTRY